MNTTLEDPTGPRGKQALQKSITWYLRQLSRLMRVLSDEELERLVPLLSERRFKPRQVIFAAGEPVERIYLVLKGTVKIYQVAENGKEVIVDIVGKGGIVGDMAIIEGAERTASAQALEETTAVSISWEDFSHVMHSSPRLAFAMAELMAGRLAGMQRTLMNLVSKPVSARLADTLVQRCEGSTIRLGLTHQELAQTIGTSRETVTALLSRFVTLGAIEPANDGYRVISHDLLDSIATGEIQVSPRHPVQPHAGAALP